jgi:uncharacterized protein YdaU (DUF1376 family)
MHYFKFNIADYKKDTDHLTFAEHGAYIKALSRYYLLEEPLPLEEEKLFRYLGAKDEAETQAIRIILDDFFTKTDVGFIHKRCDVEIEQYQESSHKASHSAKVRWQNERNANAMRSQCEGNANLLTKELKNIYKDAPEGVEDLVWKDFKKLRALKKAAITETAMNGIKREAAKANKTLNQALIICIERGWAGFKAEWVTKDEPVKPKEVWGI